MITRILAAASRGDEDAAAELWNYVYEELRVLAAQKMAQNPPGRTLQPTDLVHEAYLRLVGEQEVLWDSRAHFFGAAARAMRNVLVDQARKKGRLKRGSLYQRIPIQDAATSFEAQSLDLLALDEALRKLGEEDPRMAQVALLRFFAGLTIEETAETLGVSTATVEREWCYARAWLYREIKKGE